MSTTPNASAEILIVSGDPTFSQSLVEPFRKDGLQIVIAGDLAEARSCARSAAAELALIDNVLTDSDSLSCIRELGRVNPALGILAIVGENDTMLAIDAARLGAYDFVIKPLEIPKVTMRVHVALERHRHVLEDRAYRLALENRVNERTEEVQAHREKIRNQFVATIRALEKALQAKHVYTEGHSRRVAEKSAEIARALSLPAQEVRHIELAALFHDIGKIGIRDEVLNKADRLTDHEYEHIKRHPIVAEQILSPIEELRPIVAIVKHEHERWDGGGYPDGLKAQQIPLGARIIAVADAWDSMIFDRIYRRSCMPEDALREIESCSGTQFDPQVVKKFCAMEREKLQPSSQ